MNVPDQYFIQVPEISISLGVVEEKFSRYIKELGIDEKTDCESISYQVFQEVTEIVKYLNEVKGEVKSHDSEYLIKHIHQLLSILHYLDREISDTEWEFFSVIDELLNKSKNRCFAVIK